MKLWYDLINPKNDFCSIFCSILESYTISKKIIVFFVKYRVSLKKSYEDNEKYLLICCSIVKHLKKYSNKLFNYSYFFLNLWLLCSLLILGALQTITESGSRSRKNYDFVPQSIIFSIVQWKYHFFTQKIVEMPQFM